MIKEILLDLSNYSISLHLIFKSTYVFQTPRECMCSLWNNGIASSYINSICLIF